MARNDGGAAFPGESGNFNEGMSLRDWFATFAPVPTVEEVNQEGQIDKLSNPHNDPHKPRRRSAAEIRAELRYRYADSMIIARDLKEVV